MAPQQACSLESRLLFTGATGYFNSLSLHHRISPQAKGKRDPYRLLEDILPPKDPINRRINRMLRLDPKPSSLQASLTVYIGLQDVRLNRETESAKQKFVFGLPPEAL